MRRQPGLNAVDDAAHAARGTTTGDVSVIVPIGPGDHAWHGLAAQLADIDPPPQLVLVFAEGDPQRADAPSAALSLAVPAGRARQLNAGIAAAGRSWLWLLHADSRLRGDTVPALRGFLASGAGRLGWFRLAFLHDGPRLSALNALGANLRASWLGLPFGDQGFVLTRDDAQRLGPFDAALPFGEDHAWVWQARRVGVALRRVDGTLATSARRYADEGWARTTWRHLRLTARQALQEAAR